MFENQKIFILGFARSGYNAAKLLSKRHNEVTLCDMKEEEKQNKEQVEELRELGVNLILGTNDITYLDNTYHYFIKNPGVPLDNPLVVKAEKLGIPVINEVEMSYLLFPKNVNLIGITGTNGKTTTTTLTYEIVKRAYPDITHLAGNIGFALSSVIDEIKEGDILVMEVSCQQLANLDKFHPHIAVMTNLTPAHIDMFGSYKAYKKVKGKLFKEQTEDDIAILNIENQDVLEETKNICSVTKYFSSKHEINGCYLKDDTIYYYDEPIIKRDELLIVGLHNVENVMASIMIAKELGIDNNLIADVIKNFKGVEHRLEFVDEINGVKYYNDTEATNIKSTQIALSSFDKPVILFLGGLERGQNFDELSKYMAHVKLILAIGESRDRVLDFGNKLGIKTLVFEHLSDAFEALPDYEESGDIVLLSPASASWDQYKQCEDRGEEFKERIEELKNEDK